MQLMKNYHSIYDQNPPEPELTYYPVNPEKEHLEELITEYNWETTYNKENIETAIQYEEMQFEELIKNEPNISF